MFLLLILLLIFGITIYYPIFSGFFFMDDFYFLQSSQADNLKEFISIFKPVRFIPYRPISQQLFFFSFQKIFGLNPLPFHIFVFLIHILNSWLVYKISLNFLKDSLKARLISLIYVVSSLHFIGLYSITGSYFLFGVFYFFLGLYFWFEFEKKKNNFFYFLSFLSFTLGVFAAEIVAALPLIILLVSKLRDKLKKLWPYGLIVCLNLFINFSFAGAPKTKAFQMNLTAFPSLFRWYILRAFGLPEGVRNGYFWEKLIIYFCFSLLVLIVLTTSFLKRKLLWEQRKQIIKYFLWIIITALPFYFMPNHLNPIYFSISFIGFTLLWSQILNRKLMIFFTIIYVILSFVSINLLMHTHWVVRRSHLANEWVQKIRNNNFTKKNNTLWLFLPDKASKEELQITLGKEKAYQLFLKNNNLEVIYLIK